MTALYATACALKSAAKRAGGGSEGGGDSVVGPLESLWRSADHAAFTARGRDAWDWTVLIALPLADVAEGYRAMDERRAVKTLLTP